MKNDAIIITDIHIRPSTFYINKMVLNFAIENLKKNNPKYLFILGDTLHTKNVVNVTCLNLFESFLKEASKYCERIIVLVGNHDWAVEYSDHPFNGLKLLEKVTIVDSYYVLDNKHIFISYCREKERFLDFLEKGGNEIEFVFSHMDVDGMTPGSGWEEISPFLSPEQLSKYKKIFTGHLHLAQETTMSNGSQLIVVGTAYTTDFGESDQYKRIVYIKDLNTCEWESIDSPFTMHKTLKINYNEPFPEIDPESLKFGVEYRIFVRGTQEQLASLIKPKNYPAKIIPDIISSDAGRIDLSVVDQQDTVMRKYIDAELKRTYGDKASDFDVEMLFKIGKRYLIKNN